MTLHTTQQMADDDRRSEQFIREVDEELRRAQLKAIWDRFGGLILAVCILIVAIVGGYQVWTWWQARQAAQAGDRYMAAVDALETEAVEEGEAALREIAGEGTDGYAMLARLRLAGEAAAAGETEEAIAAYDGIRADPRATPALRDVAAVRAALVALDAGDLEGAKTRADPLDEPGGAWRHAAREILGLAAYKGGDLAAARDYFTQMQQDAETPPDLWVRAGMMVQLIDGRLAAPVAETAEGGVAPEAGAGADETAQETAQ
jgi:hypothetical protein